MDALPALIEKLGQEAAKLEAELADPKIYSGDPKIAADLAAKLEAARRELETAEERWLELEELRESLSSGRAAG